MQNRRTRRTRGLAILLAAFATIALEQNGRAQTANEPADPAITRSSQPSLLSYMELVALGEKGEVDPVLKGKLDQLLTTPFVNNEAYFAGTKPLRPDPHGAGPSLRLVLWNIERGVDLDGIKLVLTDKQGFLAKARIATEGDKKKASIQELSAQIDVLQTADVIVLNEVDWGMKRSDYQIVVKELPFLSRSDRLTAA